MSVGRAIGTKDLGVAPIEVTTRLLQRRSAMTKRQEPHHGFSDDPQKVKEAGRKGEPNANVATDKAEKARIGGQHSHGGGRGER